jgi:hypothetical protein
MLTVSQQPGPPLWCTVALPRQLLPPEHNVLHTGPHRFCHKQDPRHWLRWCYPDCRRWRQPGWRGLGHIRPRCCHEHGRSVRQRVPRLRSPLVKLRTACPDAPHNLMSFLISHFLSVFSTFSNLIHSCIAFSHYITVISKHKRGLISQAYCEEKCQAILLTVHKPNSISAGVKGSRIQSCVLYLQFELDHLMCRYLHCPLSIFTMQSPCLSYDDSRVAGWPSCHRDRVDPPCV